MENLKNKFKSIRIKLFLTLCIVVIIIIAFLIVTNNFVLETFYLYSKQKNLISVYNRINNYYKSEDSNINIELELEKAAINNNFDILIKTNRNISIYSTNKDFISTINNMNALTNIKENDKHIVYKDDKILIRRVEDSRKWINIYFVYCNFR
ncbi:MAG: hypothetical protein HFJ58_04030 [Clostridia bacterium]|nr:hypothetical protein [Clostridia bacterium]